MKVIPMALACALAASLALSPTPALAGPPAAPQISGSTFCEHVGRHLGEFAFPLGEASSVMSMMSVDEAMVIARRWLAPPMASYRGSPQAFWQAIEEVMHRIVRSTRLHIPYPFYDVQVSFWYACRQTVDNTSPAARPQD